MCRNYIAFLIVLLFSSNFVFGQDKTVVAVVEGTSITQNEIDYLIAGKILPLQEQISNIRKIALENYITNLLLEKEADRKEISVQEFKKSLTNLGVDVPYEEVESQYLKNREAFGLMNSEEAKERIRLDLINFAKMRAYRSAIAELEKKANITYFKDAFIQKVETDRQGPILGNKEAKISIVEFSDFLCSHCRRSHGVIKQVLNRYAGEVNLIFKHLPLQPNSQILARASVCADKQGRFWDYHDQLFESENLSERIAIQIARKLELNVAEFERCISANDSLSIVVRDQNEAKRLGLDSTPTFIINGEIVRGTLELEAFVELIESHM